MSDMEQFDSPTTNPRVVVSAGEKKLTDVIHYIQTVASSRKFTQEEEANIVSELKAAKVLMEQSMQYLRSFSSSINRVRNTIYGAASLVKEKLSEEYIKAIPKIVGRYTTASVSKFGNPVLWISGRINEAYGAELQLNVALNNTVFY